MHLANNLFFLICPFFVIGLSFQAQNDYDLSEFVDHMEILSRLTNGIILEAGLIDKSIPPDDVISEILHLGAQKIDKLLEIDRVKLLNIITKYQSLSQGLNISSEIEAVEERFHLLENIATEITFGDLSDLDGKTEYEDGVKELEKLNTDMGVVDNLFSNLTEIEEKIENVRNIDISNLTKSELNAKLGAIKSMVEDIEEFIKNVTEFNIFVTEIGKISDFEKMNISFLDQLKFEKELRDRYDSKIRNGTKIQLDLINKNVEHLHESSQFFNVSHNLMNPILELISTRIDDRKWTEKFTSTFSKHPSDIQRLPDDAKNEGLKLLFSKKESDWISEHLSKSLVPLADFGKILTEFDARWEILSLKTSLDDLSFVNDIQIQLGKNFELKNIQLQKLKSFEECDNQRPNESVQTLEKIEEIINAKNELKEAYSKLGSMDYTKQLPDLKTLKIFKTWKRLGKKEADSLKLNKEINETLDLIRKLKESLPDFKEQVHNISELIKKVSSTPINEYLKSLEDSGYLAFYSCLKREIGEKGKVVVDLLNEIDEIRKRGLENATKTQEASEIVNAFVSSLDGLKNLRTYGEGMKNVTEMEVIALKNAIFNDSLIIMKKVQKSVEGLSHIRKLSEKRTELGAIFGDLDFIKTTAEKEKDKLKIKEYDELLKLDNLKTSLKTLLSKIDKMNVSIGGLEASNFSSFIPIFQEANEIEDVKEDVELMVTALNSLKNVDSTIQENITDLVDALDILKSLNLKFSTFEILSGIEGLRSLDAFFSYFSSEIPPPPTVPPPSTTEVIFTEITTILSSQVAVMKQTGNTTASTMPEWQIGLIVAICLILAAAIIFGILCYCRRWFCFKNRKGKSASSPNKDNFIEIFPPPVPAVPAEESLYIPPTSTYQPLSTLPPAPSKTEQPKKETSSDGAQSGGQEFPPAEITVEPTQETEAKTKTVEEGPAETKSKEGATGSKESVSKGSKSKEETKMKPSQEVM